MKAIGAGFGLLVFLISVAIMFWMWTMYTSEVAKHALPAQRQAQQWAGQDEHGGLAINSLTLVPEVQNGRLRYVLVESILPQGAYAKYYHLQQNDAIIAVAGLDLRDDDAELALAKIQEAYQRTQELTVVRGTQKIALPEGRVIETTVSLVDFPKPTTTQPTTRPSDERVLRKELGPIQGLFK